MAKVIDLTGFKKDNITVIGDSGERYKHGGIIWLYKCNCGKISKSRSYDIVYKIKSCGCINPKKYDDKTLSAQHDLFSQYKYNAKSRDRIFNLTFEQFINLTKQNCYYCNQEPIAIWISSKKCKIPSKYIYNGVDRLNNDIGYEIYNCVACCSKCNQMKWKLNEDIFIKQINSIYSNLKNKGKI